MEIVELRMPEAPIQLPPPLPLPIEGMTCASRVERSLAKVPGVTDAPVNLAGGTAEVQGTAASRAALAFLRLASIRLMVRGLCQP
jgi:cation transport ATPase